MSRSFKDVEYTKVDLDSPHRDFRAKDTSVGLHDGEEDDEIDSSGTRGAAAGGAASASAAAASATASGASKEDEAEDQQAKKPSVLSMAYYQRFFNVDTRQVGIRLIGSFVPRLGGLGGGGNFVLDNIRHSPDLYGPFWVSTTLVFTLAIAGNLTDYFQSAGSRAWRYDFGKVTVAATAVYLYWWLLPLVLWALGWWRQLPERLAFLELLCLYGYSLAVYIPVSILCAVPQVVLQWLLTLLAMCLSGSVLALSLWPSVMSGDRRTGLALLTVAGLFHAALAVGFKLYFFQVGASSSVDPATPVSPNSTTVASSSYTVPKSG